MNDAIINLSDVRVTLPGPSGPVNVLRGVDFTARPGESVSITGPSGSGKTTLLMVMSGLMRPASGSVEVAGSNLEAMDEDALAAFRRDNIGIVFQAFHLVPSMTALENVALPLELAGDHAPFEKAERALESVGLGERARHYPAQLSGGEQQRVAVARAIAPSPSILLADEPTGNLDADTGAGVMDLLFNLGRETGATLILVTHDRDLAARSARQAGMRDGHLQCPGGD